MGGRLATRTAADGSLKGAPSGLVFDHAAQVGAPTTSVPRCCQCWCRCCWYNSLRPVQAAQPVPLPTASPDASSSPLMLAFAYHPVQYFTARDPVFQAMVQQWESNGAVRRWEGPVVGTLQDGVFAPDDASSSGAVRCAKRTHGQPSDATVPLAASLMRY